MNGARYFLDTFFAAALLNEGDGYHDRAREWLTPVRAAQEVWTTEAVLIEIADTLSAIDRLAAAEFIWRLRRAANVRIAKVDLDVIERGLKLYESRRDKTWGLTDCISFLVMQEQGLTDALTADEHFTQAGFKAVFRAKE
jgi:hypothetical protein